MCDAELILELPMASLAEVMPTNKENEASVVIRVKPSADDQQPCAINIISIYPTEAQVVEIQEEIGVEPHEVQTSKGCPLLFILAGEYKIPLRAEVPCININESIEGVAKAYQFDVLSLQLQIQFPSDTPRLIMQHFEEVLVQQHCLTVGGANQTVYNAPSQGAMQSLLAQQPQWDMPAPGENANNKNSSTTNAIVSGLSQVGGGVASGLRTGAVVLASAITSGAQYVITNTDKTEKPVAVPESWNSGVKTARMTSKGAVRVTAGVAKSLIGVTSIVSDVISNKLRTVIKNDDSKDPDSDTVRSLKLVGLTTADQAIGLYEAATDSARTILTATCAGICQVVEHKLGQEAGNFAEDGLGLVQDTYDASKALGSVGTKGIVRSTIKATAVKTLKDDP